MKQKEVNEVIVDTPTSYPTELEDEPFYEDFKRRKSARRVTNSPVSNERSISSSTKILDKCNLEKEQEWDKSSIHGNTHVDQKKKNDPPPRINDKIAEKPKISSEDNIEEELRALLKQKLKNRKVPSKAQEKASSPKSETIPQTSRRIIASYTRKSRRKQDSLSLRNEIYDQPTRNKSKKPLYDDVTPSEHSNQLILNITPDNPPTPPLINNDDNEYSANYGLDLEESANFSPNTTLSGLNALNHSFGGSSSDKANSTSKTGDTGECAEEYKIKSSQELNSSFVENILKDEFNEETNEEEMPMDWDATASIGILNELKQCRENLQRNPSHSSIPSSLETEFLRSSSNDFGTKLRSTVYVIIDTNIFIAQLRMIEKLFSSYYNGHELHGFVLKIYVPWAVLEELDKLKSAGSRSLNPNMELQMNARRAIGFLHDKLVSKDKMLTGQSQEEEQKAEIYKAHHADDRILRTCLQMKAEGKCVLLYTNDKNLANKTIISGIHSYDSTKILNGIDETVKEWKLSTKVDAPKKYNSDTNILVSSHVSMNENILNQTLVPESDEEDMIVDTENHLPLEQNVSTNVSTVDDLYHLFEDVWYIIYKYTCRYAISLNIQLGNLPQPKVSELPPNLVPKHNVKHLNQLLNGVIQLAKSLNELLKINPTSLAVNSKELTNFHGSLTLFLVKLDRYRPNNHPKSPDHPPIRPSVMLNFALQPIYREKLNSGLNQLVELRTILHCCKENFNS